MLDKNFFAKINLTNTVCQPIKKCFTKMVDMPILPESIPKRILSYCNLFQLKLTRFHIGKTIRLRSVGQNYLV